jgi:SAM-dependent methyltransferase
MTNDKLKKKKRRDKFTLYERSVQNPRFEVKLMRRIYRKRRGQEPRYFREDFCGTALFASEWARRVKGGKAQGVDLDGPTLEWGEKHNVRALGKKASRIQLLQADVRETRDFSPDITAALNFSYCCLKTRQDLLDYFCAVYRTLAREGLFVADIYGGPEAQGALKEVTRHKGFSYVWHQGRYNPVTGEMVCHISFGFPDGKKMRRAFTYDWRLWTLPEVTDVLAEAGFSEVDVYWEGTDSETGEGNGVFRPTRKGDDSAAWIAYVAAWK